MPRAPMTLCFLATAAGCILAGSLSAQTTALGHTEFPNSGAAEAQEPFIRGLLLLHSFEYDRARDAFREAQRRDPDFAMAYWGEAMTWNHPVWFRQYRDRARAALEQLAPTPAARLAKAPTEREKAYLAAVETLFGEGPKATRDTLYMEAMREMHQRWPEDENAAAFYALSILGTSHGGRDVPTYMRAAAVVEEVFRDNPQHPGAAHYLIHSYDDPIHAPLGLRAARAYAKIAPDAAHAQHMTSHIFVALGMWDEVVSQNTVAANATSWGPGHYTSWLSYGLVQQGRYQEAVKLLQEARGHMSAAAPAGQRGYLVHMRGDYVVCAERWTSPVLEWSIATDDLLPHARAEDAFVQGFAAVKRGDVASAERWLTRVAAAAQAAATTSDLDSAGRTVPRILEKELRGLLALAGGRNDAGLALLREATALEDAMPFEFGPPAVVKPSHELLAEVLLELGRSPEAQREFERALELTPKRALALRGLVTAAERNGDAKTAQRAHALLQES